MDGVASILGLAFGTAITPGPNNAVIMALGARVGIRGAASAIAVLVAALVFLVLGLGRALVSLPDVLVGVLEFVGGCFLAGMALVPARRAVTTEEGHPSLSSSLAALAAFQVLNPKTWLFAGLVVTRAKATGTPDWLAAAVAAAVSSLCLMGWAGGGALLARQAARSVFAVGVRRSLSALLLLVALAMILHAAEFLTRVR